MAVHSGVSKPNPVRVAWTILNTLRTTSPPSPSGSGTVDHSGLRGPLRALAEGGLPSLVAVDADVATYIQKMRDVGPNELSRDEALAFWINLYNAGAMYLAAEAWLAGDDSVIRIPGAFRRPMIDVAGEELSLAAIEHGKIRRFKDPRIHGALVCGSLSCPTLRREPYSGTGLDSELDDQMRVFLAGGGAMVTGDGTLALSRVFRWYGRDFVAPSRMPAFLPARKARVFEAILSYLPDEATKPAHISYQSYDWGLACNVA